MKHKFRCSLLGLALSCSLVMAGIASAQNYMVNAVARFDMYVSSVDYGGIPVGVDTPGCGGRAVPCLTLDYALTFRLLNSRFYLNGNPASPPTYITSSGLTAGNYSVLPVNDYGALFAGTGTTQALTVPLDGHITLGKIIVDPSQNSGGAAAVCVTVPNNATTASRMELTLVATKFQNWTSQCINASGTTRANISSTGSIFNGGNVDGAIFVTGFAAGTVTSTNDVCTLTAQKLVNVGGCVVVIGSNGSTGMMATVTNPTFSCTLDGTLTGVGLHYCIRLHDTVGTISGGSSAVLNAPGARTGAPVYLSHTNNNISNGSISNINVTNTTNGGYGCGTGNESVTAAPTSTGITISQCRVTGNATSGAGALHGVFIGANIASSAANDNECVTCGISYVNKLGTSNSFTGNTATGWYTTAFLMKGATSPTASNNNGNQTIVAGSTIGLSMADDTPGSGTHTTGATVTGNTITNTAGTSFIYFSVDVDNTFAISSPANDNYVNAGGTYAANQFRIAGTDYTSCANYRTAVEPSATCTP